MVEAVALNLADNADAKMETLTELFDAAPAGNEWLGYNRFLSPTSAEQETFHELSEK